MPPKAPAPKKRKYQEAWEKIKKDKKLQIVAPAIVHARIVKAIQKEKYMDAAFKLCNDHDYFYLDVSIDRKTNTITFVLKQRFGLEGIRNAPA